MDKRLILAKAGSGKTHYICNNIDPKRRNLIIAYTNQNISNIVNEIIRAHGEIPESTEIVTFHSFIYRNFIRPFETIIGDIYSVEEFRSKGVSFLEPEQPYVNGKYNNKYIKNTSIGHFYTYNCEQIYLKKMTYMLVQNNVILQYGIDYMKAFFDNFYIDEVQDFRQDDWKIIEKIITSIDNVVLVGDFYQHSVSGDNNSGLPFSKYKTLEDYKKYISKLGLTVDENTLNKSRRCTDTVCKFVEQKTGINLESYDLDSKSIVKIVQDKQELYNLLNNDYIIKLLLNNSSKVQYKSINWGYSKGDTYNSVLVILPRSYDVILSNDVKLDSEISRNKLYVALTRTKGDLYVVDSSLYKMCMMQYIQ